jgi:hypothetical protein
MFRKTILAIAATAALGAAALAPTTASAGGWHGKHHGHHHHHHFKHRHYGFNSYYAPVYAGYVGGCVWKKRWVNTYHGSYKKWVKVCY